MKKHVLSLLALVLLICFTPALAAEWKCPQCGYDAAGNFCCICGTPGISDSWICIDCKNENTGNFCNNCGSAKPDVQTGRAAIPDPDLLTQHTVVKNYVGRTIAQCGYTSMGGERRDYYADTNLLLVLLEPDGIYIDPDDEDILNEYSVVAQYPTANTEFDITSNLEGEMVNKGYEEIILVVCKNGTQPGSVPVLAKIPPSPEKSTHYVRDYTGRSLNDVGYTTWGGKRLDAYGPDGHIEIFITDDKGNSISPNDYGEFTHYIVINQSVEPGTEIKFFYSEDSSGSESVTGQTLDMINITVAVSEGEQAKIDAQAAEEKRLRESGAIVDLFTGTYEIGKDMEPGNYTLALYDSNGSSDVYIYQSKNDLDNNNGDWKFLYGKDDKEYLYLKEGMYLQIKRGAAKATKTEFSTEGSEFVLFTGTYCIGEELLTGNYELYPINDNDSGDVYVYQNRAKLNESDGDWLFLYGKNDKEYLQLQSGMILKVSSGAVKVIVK